MRTLEDARPASPQPLPPRDTGSRGPWYIALAVLVVLGLIAAAVALIRDDDPSPSGSTGTTRQTTPASAPVTTVPQGRDNTAMWPLPGSDDSFATPSEAAESFAVDYLGFEEPVVGEFLQGDSRSGEVEIRPIATGPVTTVLVRQLSGEESWSVLGSATANIEVTEPAALEPISSPVVLAGRALAFEGNVNVSVRSDDGGKLGEGFVTGGGDEMRPFTGSIAFETPPTPYGVVVFATYSAKDGSLWEAASLRIEFAKSTDIDAAACGAYRSPRPSLASDEMEVKVYFTCGAGTSDGVAFPVYRAVEKSPGVLNAAMEALLRGPNNTERGAGVASFFSNETALMLRSVKINDGHAVVDFGDLRPVIPNASASAGSAQFLAELDATVFQFSSVRSAEYRIEGSCEAFSEWLQFGGCEPRTRATSED